MSITGQRFLITGGASLIGSHLTRLLLAAGADEVVLYDNLSLGSASLLDAFGPDGRVRSIRGDVLRLPQLVDAVSGVHGIFALAGYLTLPFSEHPAVGADVNVMGMINTLEAARSGACRIVFASSVAVYGGDVAGVIDESRAFRSDDISAASASYGASKLLGESLGRLYAQRYSVECCALRFSTVYGERQHARGINALYILEAMQAARAGRPIVVRGSGGEAHDYLYAGDAARACVRAMGAAGANGAFNVASGRSTSVNDVVAMVREEYGSTLEPEHVDDTRTVRSTAHHELHISTARAKDILGWEPTVPLREGIARLRRWLDADQK
ncbi:MAG: GDP-mannose 4,6-dehydratase [Acidobacteriota bacterium]